jgi:integrase/recombinase XerD
MTQQGIRVSVIPSIAIFVRHTKKCKYRGDESHKTCRCPKHLRWSHGKQQVRQSAKTRSWTAAEDAKRKFEAKFEAADPSKPVGAVTIEASTRTTIEKAIKLFVSDKRTQGVSDGVLGKYELELGRLEKFAAAESRYFPAELSKELLTRFRATWNRLYPSSNTRIKVQERLRGFLRYCFDAELMSRVPRLSPISATEVPTLPLTDEQYTKLLDTVPETFETTPDKAKRIRCLILLMRHSGLAIRDAVTLERSELKHDTKKALYRVTTSRQKTGTHVSVAIPPDVATEILSVPNGNPVYFFWNRGEGAPETVVKKYHADLRRLFDKAGMPDGHPHQLRDTFAVGLLSKGVPMEELSKALGHKSIKTTELHYAKWVQSRQDRADALIVGTWS